jgi:prolyl-tRNA editing enzyme YbaK/EbsC (Cys-tRNA(Pro) deacylase)
MHESLEASPDRPSARDRIFALLDEHGVAYRHLEHEPTRTSEDSARVRGESMRIGGKSLLIKAGSDRFVLVVVSAALKVNSNRMRRELGVDRSRFATVDELKAMTGLVPGSVPPFGEPILPFPLYVDESVLANERIAFNAGSLTDSVIMQTADYRRIARIERAIDVGRS